MPYKVKQRWGNTEAYIESERKTSKYSKEDCARIQERTTKIYQKIIENMDKGPDDPIIQEGIGEFRPSITDFYYNCTPEIFRGLGEMYVADDRFMAFYENMKPGLAHFMRDAMNIYCDNLAKG